MNTLPVLKPGDSVELIAPASRCSDSQLAQLKALCESWQLNCIVKENIFAQDLLCANTDEARFRHLKDALTNSETKAVICARGGYGSMRLIPNLREVIAPVVPKIFVGMSDITCLQLYLQQCWGWPVVHGAAAPDRYSTVSIAALKSLLFADVAQINFQELTPLNQQAKENCILQSQVIGGNLAIIQAGMGTFWQMDGRDKFILLEEIGERGYRVDRMLEHLQQGKIFKNAKAILLGDFLGGDEADGSSLIAPVLQRFAERCTVPVVRIKGVGHGYTNFPIPCGTPARLYLGSDIQLTCFR